MDVERQEGSCVKVERRVPRVLQRYSVYRIMTKGIRWQAHIKKLLA